MDKIFLGLLKTTMALLQKLPHRLLVALLTRAVTFVQFLFPRYRSIAARNLEIAFPEKDQSWRADLLLRSNREFGRLIADSIRAPRLGKKWIEEHVDFKDRERYHELRNENAEGMLVITGHLGSFELLGHTGALLGSPMSVVARDFKNPVVNSWWRSAREVNGNTIISRAGAYRKILNDLRQGRDVAILFDQNVTRNTAVFVDFFSRKAATTRAPALALLQTEVTLIVASLKYIGQDNYEVNWEQCDVKDVLDSDSPREEKIEEITRRMSRLYEDMIRDFPEGWFWMHRRWKTTPLSGDEGVYE